MAGYASHARATRYVGCDPLNAPPGPSRRLSTRRERSPGGGDEIANLPRVRDHWVRDHEAFAMTVRNAAIHNPTAVNLQPSSTTTVVNHIHRQPYRKFLFRVDPGAPASSVILSGRKDPAFSYPSARSGLKSLILPPTGGLMDLREVYGRINGRFKCLKIKPTGGTGGFLPMNTVYARAHARTHV
jgi:hypothetical protein